MSVSDDAFYAIFTIISIIVVPITAYNYNETVERVIIWQPKAF